MPNVNEENKFDINDKFGQEKYVNNANDESKNIREARHHQNDFQQSHKSESDHEENTDSKPVTHEDSLKMEEILGNFNSDMVCLITSLYHN